MSLKGDYGSRIVLATLGSGISFQVDKPGKLVLANVLSRLMWALLLWEIVPVLSRGVGHLWQGKVVASEQVVEYPGGTSPEQLRSKGQLSLAVTFQCLLARANDLRTAFTLQHCLPALLLLVHADSEFGTGSLFLSKGSRKKKFKTKNSSGCV